MKIDNEFPERLLSMRQTHSMTQTNVAMAVSVTQRQIAAYEAGSAKPREKTLFKLAYHLGVSPSWLANGSNTDIDEWDDFTPTTNLVQIPIYDLDTLTEKQIDGDKKSIQPNIELHPLANELKNNSKNCFAIKVYGDSMEISGHLGMPDGSIVTFDPSSKIKSGDICLIKIDNYYTIKQLFIDTNQTTARSLNPNYADIVLKKDEYKVIAKAVHIAITL